MKYKGKLNLSPVTYTTGMKSLYGNPSLCQSEQIRISRTTVVLRGSSGRGICCVQHSPIAVFGAALVLSSNFVEEIRIFFLSLPDPCRISDHFVKYVGCKAGKYLVLHASYYMYLN